jgi:hypothetical protein
VLFRNWLRETTVQGGFAEPVHWKPPGPPPFGNWFGGWVVGDRFTEPVHENRSADAPSAVLFRNWLRETTVQGGFAEPVREKGPRPG